MTSESVTYSLRGHDDLDSFRVAINTSIASLAFSDVQRVTKIKSASSVL